MRLNFHHSKSTHNNKINLFGLATVIDENVTLFNITECVILKSPISLHRFGIEGNLYLCLINYEPHHADVWGMEPDGDEWSASCLSCFTSGER
jgi:hypothetical protein